MIVKKITIELNILIFNKTSTITIIVFQIWPKIIVSRQAKFTVFKILLKYFKIIITIILMHNRVILILVLNKISRISNKSLFKLVVFLLFPILKPVLEKIPIYWALKMPDLC